MKRLLFALMVGFTITSQARAETVNCDEAISTIEINECAAMELETAEKQLAEYLQASLDIYQQDEELVTAINQSQHDWLTYRDAHCSSIYTQWRDGTIRGAMALSCKTQLTQRRTQELWDSFLTNMDSSSPVLPEPK